ncbi:hypothetical protein [Rudanella lutea]|uniref:hypothetical protein n=1 Tax=Rudanella lutea TaxID=451374 RepID=UPI00036E1C60|nr:hypothetical protein [Rudanella lutea]
MQKSFLVAFVALMLGLFPGSRAVAQYNNWAVGFRLGEPSGINVRKYFRDTKAFDLNVGSYGGLYGNTREYRQGRYRSIGLSVQGHYVWHNRLFGRDNLRGYYGLGGQVNRRRYYPDNLRGQQIDYIAEISLGGSAIAGLEYFVPDKPFSVFLESGLYVEVLPAPLFMNVQSGLGLRYNF